MQRVAKVGRLVGLTALLLVVGPTELAWAQPIEHEINGDWRVLEWKEYQQNECVLISKDDHGSSIALQFVDQGSRDYAIGVTDVDRSFPEVVNYDAASVQVDYGDQIKLGAFNFVAYSSHFETEQIYFSFKTIDDFFLLIDQLRIGGNVFFFYDPKFKPTIVEIGKAGEALDTFVDCIRKYR